MKSWILALAALAAAGPAAAQQHQHHSPYMGLENRQIKALSDSQVQQLQNGEGMSLALAAELNHYPGPRHVLDLAEELDLTGKQRQEAQALVATHQARARDLGVAIVARERELDQAFARHTITEPRLRELTGDIARLNGELRYLHLAAHLEMRKVLTEKQIKQYDQLRGYARAASPR